MDKNKIMVMGFAGIIVIAVLILIAYMFTKDSERITDNELLSDIINKSTDLSLITNTDITGLADTYYNYLTVTDRDEPIGDDD